ncbi:MAG: DUF91 domain-containing protein, partial [Cyanobacteria bacterium Co-bin8]|nr:DUF91 domain-containing protein [Cyanobacteria bacterium Co-bin8]
MPEEIKLWEVQENQPLKEIKRKKLGFERQIEDWLEKDISILSKDFLVIGRQVGTHSGGIDLLCIDKQGDLIIVE